MKITKPDHTLLLQNYHVIDKQAFLFISLGYVVDVNNDLLEEQKTWPWLLTYFDKEPIDLALKKRRGTFAVAGKAHAHPFGTTTTQMAVQAKLGSLEKTLYVFGDRHWEQGLIGWQASEPLPFSQMPVDLSHAFGASSSPDNPYGKGYYTLAPQVGAPLPNIELPTQLIHSPTDCPPVATFSALASGSSTKQSWLGKLDEAWQQQHFPWLPVDTDPRWFDAVPQDQAQASYWQGHENWSVTGMNAHAPTVQGTLPALSPRLLVQQNSHIVEAHLDLDTVWLFPNEQRVLLWYRAAIPVAREDAKDITAIAVFTENQSVQSSLSQLEEQWQTLLSPEEKTTPVVAEPTLPNNTVVALSAETLALQKEFTADIQNSFNAEIKELNEALEKMEKQMGIAIPRIEPIEIPISDTWSKGSSLSTLDAQAFEQQLRLDIENALEEGLVQAKQAIQEIAKPLQLNEKKLIDMVLSPSSGHTPVSAIKDLSALLEQAPISDELRQTVLTAIKQLESQLPVPDALHIDEDTLENIPLLNKNFKKDSLEKADFSYAVLDNCDFSQTDLTKANFTGAQIINCSFHTAQLSESIWEMADIRDSDFTAATLKKANMSQATLSHCLFNQAQMQSMYLANSTFDHCELNQALLAQSDLRSATMIQSQLTQADFTQVQWPDARVSNGSDFSYALFTQANLQKASLQDSIFTAADFTEANLSNAFIQNSSLDQSTAHLLIAKNASFQDISLRAIQWPKANLMQSSFMHCLLINADLQGSNLFGVDTRTTQVNTIFLEGALLSRSSLAKYARS